MLDSQALRIFLCLVQTVIVFIFYINLFHIIYDVKIQVHGNLQLNQWLLLHKASNSGSTVSSSGEELSHSHVVYIYKINKNCCDTELKIIDRLVFFEGKLHEALLYRTPFSKT